MVINSSTHSPDNRVQGLPSIDVQILPQEVSQAYPLGREARILAGKLQQPVPFSRSSTVAGKLQKVESRKILSSDSPSSSPRDPQQGAAICLGEVQGQLGPAFSAVRCKNVSPNTGTRR